MCARADVRRVRVPVSSRSTRTWHRRPAEGCVCGTILHACVLVWGCAGDGRVVAVPAAGGRHGPLQCLAIGRTEHASAHHGAPSVECIAKSSLNPPDGFKSKAAGGPCTHSETSTNEAQHRTPRAAHAQRTTVTVVAPSPTAATEERQKGARSIDHSDVRSADSRIPYKTFGGPSDDLIRSRNTNRM